jgi:hypothetical protein
MLSNIQKSPLLTHDLTRTICMTTIITKVITLVKDKSYTRTLRIFKY